MQSGQPAGWALVWVARLDNLSSIAKNFESKVSHKPRRSSWDRLFSLLGGGLGLERGVASEWRPRVCPTFLVPQTNLNWV